MGFPRLAALVLVVFAALPPCAAAESTPQPRARVDKALRDAMRAGSKHRVIVRYSPGKEDQVRQRLSARKARSLAAHREIGALSIEIPAEEIARALGDPDILGMSLDEIAGIALRR